MEFRKPAFPATGSLLTRSTSHCNLASSSLRGTAFAKTMIHSYLQLGELHDTVDSLNLRPCVEHQYATLYPLAASSPLSFLLAHCDGFISLSLLYLSPTCSICPLPFSISVLVILLDQTIHDPRFSLPQVPINLSSSLSALEVRASLFWLVDDSSLFQISSFSLLFLILILLPDLSLLVTKYSLLLRLHALTLFMTLYYDFRKTHGTRAVQTTDAIKQMT